jgi:hypothetical protein
MDNYWHEGRSLQACLEHYGESHERAQKTSAIKNRIYNSALRPPRGSFSYHPHFEFLNLYFLLYNENIAALASI